MKNFQFTAGIDLSFKILKLLKKDKSLKSIEVHVGCFTNGRESGLTYRVWNKKFDSFTFCTYEHRNSDSIIINGRENYGGGVGELPYIADSKWVSLDACNYQEYEIASEKLSNLIKKWYTTGKID